MIHKGRCVMHYGMAAPGTVPGRATVGPIGAAAMKSGSGNYLANLILFPGMPHMQASASLSAARMHVCQENLIILAQ